MSLMRLIVNYVSSNEYPEKFSIGDLLRYQNVEPVPWLVVGVNNVFYRTKDFENVYLKEGDKVDLVYIRGGG